MRCAFTLLAEADLESIGDYTVRDNPIIDAVSTGRCRLADRLLEN